MEGTAESSHTDQQTGGREGSRVGGGGGRRIGIVESFELSLPITHLLQQGHTFQSFQNNAINWKPNIQKYEFISAILIQTTTVTLQDLMIKTLL